LELNGPGSYQYDVKIAFSFDEGLNWTTPIIPHDDRSKREHGFVSLIPAIGRASQPLYCGLQALFVML